MATEAALYPSRRQPSLYTVFCSLIWITLQSREMCFAIKSLLETLLELSLCWALVP